MRQIWQHNYDEDWLSGCFGDGDGGNENDSAYYHDGIFGGSGWGGGGSLGSGGGGSRDNGFSRVYTNELIGALHENDLAK